MCGNRYADPWSGYPYPYSYTYADCPQTVYEYVYRFAEYVYGFIDGLTVSLSAVPSPAR